MFEDLFPVLVFFIGLAGGFVSGFLGVGCGIIITPMLMEFEIQPLTAVATQLCHAVGTNLTNFLTYKRKHDVDFALAIYLLIGGMFGALCEWSILKNYSSPQATFNKFVYIYVVVLVLIGIGMLMQSMTAWKNRFVRSYNKGVLMRRWMLYLPFHKIFVRSRAEMSVLIPLFVGFLAGILVASLGGGSNLFMAPIITYLIGRISPVVNGTIAFAGCFITIVISLIYSGCGYCCDMFYVLLLFMGAAFGSWCGVELTYRVKRYYTYAISVVVVFVMATRQVIKLINHSFSMDFIAVKSNTLNWVFSSFTEVSPVLYTVMCLFVIVVIAYFYEKWLQKIYDMKRLSRLSEQDG